MTVTDKVQRTKVKNMNGEIKIINWQKNNLNNNTMFWFDGSSEMFHGTLLLKQILKMCKYE